MSVTRADLITRLRNPATSTNTQNTILLTGAACDDMREAASEIERLTAENEAIRKDRDDLLQQGLGVEAERDIARMENERLRAALSSSESWIDRWTSHVGTCEGGNKCTCGRSAVLFDAGDALNQQETTKP